MDSRKRKRIQGCLRMRKHRAITKILENLESSSSSSDIQNDTFIESSEGKPKHSQLY